MNRLNKSVISLAMVLGFSSSLRGFVACPDAPVPWHAVACSAVMDPFASVLPPPTEPPPTAFVDAVAGAGGSGNAISADNPATGQNFSLPDWFHPYYSSWFKSAHVTPYGLVISDKGITIGQTLGADFDLYKGRSVAPISHVYLSAGLITYINGQTQQKPYIDGVNELEPYAGLYVQFFNCLTANVKYKEFYSIYNNFQTIDQTQFGLAFDDSRWLHPVSIHPFIDLRFAEHDDYALLGVCPTVHLKPANIPMIVTMPTWTTIGPPDFWGGLSHAGVFSTGATATFPLTFIPHRFGRWHVDVGMQYYCDLSHQLIRTSQFIGSGGHRNICVAFTGFGVHF